MGGGRRKRGAVWEGGGSSVPAKGGARQWLPMMGERWKKREREHLGKKDEPVISS